MEKTRASLGSFGLTNRGFSWYNSSRQVNKCHGRSFAELNKEWGVNPQRTRRRIGQGTIKNATAFLREGLWVRLSPQSEDLPIAVGAECHEFLAVFGGLSLRVSAGRIIFDSLFVSIKVCRN